MKKRSILLILAVILLAAFALGATGGVALSGGNADGETARQTQGNLIGVLVTTEPLDLFDFEAYFNDHAREILNGSGEIGMEEAQEYGGRLYAAYTEEPRGKYEFPDVEGFCHMSPRMKNAQGEYNAVFSDEVFDATNIGVKSTDAGDELTLEATIYACDDSNLRAFYINPVYQEESGAVYAVSGQGTSFGGELAGAHTTTLTDTKTVTENGETTELTSSMTITICYVPRTAETTITQFSAQGELLKRETFAPEEVPDAMEPEKDAAYLIVETSDVHGNVTRKLVDSGEDGLSTATPRADGICVQKWTELLWKKAAQ